MKILVFAGLLAGLWTAAAVRSDGEEKEPVLNEEGVDDEGLNFIEEDEAVACDLASHPIDETGEEKASAAPKRMGKSATIGKLKQVAGSASRKIKNVKDSAVAAAKEFKEAVKEATSRGEVLILQTEPAMYDTHVLNLKNAFLCFWKSIPVSGSNDLTITGHLKRMVNTLLKRDTLLVSCTQADNNKEVYFAIKPVMEEGSAFEKWAEGLLYALDPSYVALPELQAFINTILESTAGSKLMTWASKGSSAQAVVEAHQLATLDSTKERAKKNKVKDNDKYKLAEEGFEKKWKSKLKQISLFSEFEARLTYSSPLQTDKQNMLGWRVVKFVCQDQQVRYEKDGMEVSARTLAMFALVNAS